MQPIVVNEAVDVGRSYASVIDKACAILAEIDVLCRRPHIRVQIEIARIHVLTLVSPDSFAHVAVNAPTSYAKPTLTGLDSDNIGVRAARHPYVEFQDNTHGIRCGCGCGCGCGYSVIPPSTPTPTHLFRASSLLPHSHIFRPQSPRSSWEQMWLRIFPVMVRLGGMCTIVRNRRRWWWNDVFCNVYGRWYRGFESIRVYGTGANLFGFKKWCIERAGDRRWVIYLIYDFMSGMISVF